MPKKVYAVVITIVMLFGANIFLALKNSSNYIPANQWLSDQIEYTNGQAYILPIAGPNYIPILDSDFPRPQVSARSAVVYDTKSARFLYDENSNTKLPIASLTKVLSSVIVLENLNLDDIVTISERSIKVDKEKQDLYLGEKLSVRNLLKLMLIESSNDAAYALADHANKSGFNFVEAMNKKSVSVGMKDSFFVDPAGLNDSGYSTAQDLVKLVGYSLNYPEIWDISSEKTAIIESSDERIKHQITSTNRLLGLIKDIIGGKTGYTDI